jgi:M6 family metalloprotease-like protein
MKKYLFFLLLIYFSLNNTQAQTSQAFCSLDETGSASITTSGTFRILIVLCKFSDDNFDQSPHTDLWPHTLNSMPSWGPDLVSSTVQQSYSNPSMSGYFKTMSRGLYDVIGDVVFYIPQHNQSYYFLSSGRHIGYLTEEILTAINPVVNYANYDNNGDGKVDMIQICFRFANTLELDWKYYHPTATNGYQGIAGLAGDRGTFASGTTLTMDGKTISSATLTGSGTFQNGVIDLHGGLPVMVHEFGHYLFGGVHYAGVGFHGLMDGNGTGVMSSFERIKLGWVSPITINSNSYDSILTDALTTHKVYKIQRPGGNDYFLIDNHQRLNFYESSWKQYNNGPFVSPGTGILISHISSSLPSASPDIESAFGRWNWKTSGSVLIYPFEKDVSNRNAGRDKLDLRGVNTTQGIKNHPDFLGSADDFVNIGYNQIFSPWSNPSTYQDNSNICVELLQIDQNKNAHLNLYVQNAYLAPPSKPQNLKVSVNQYDEAVLTWEANIEDDIKSGGKYKIYRAEVFGTGEPTSWDLIETIDAYNGSTPITSWTDGASYINYANRWLHYKISAFDNTNKESVPSDKVKINGKIPKRNSGEKNNVISSYELRQNHPNPFNPVTIVQYDVKEKGFVSLIVYDVLGREVASLVNESQDEGSYSVNFDARNLPSSVYIYSLRVNDFVQNRKMTLLK